MIKTAILDVTKIEPRLKHPTIFDHFDALVEGEAFEILNDHDPKPLYYQLLGERGNYFTWEYKENGPQYWRVRIAKPATTTSQEETVGAIAAKDVRKADVFKKLGIDFCCGGKKTIKQAAEKIGLSESELKAKLARAENSEQVSANLDFDKWTLSFLIDYIVNVHHRYVRENSVIIEQLADKVAIRHGLDHPELVLLAQHMQTFLGELNSHLQQEEEQLFPLIKKVEAGDEGNRDAFLRIIDHLEEDHENTGEGLANFRIITADYQLPANACNSYTYLFEKIKDFENDLLQHIHLENNILFPKTLTLQ